MSRDAIVSTALAQEGKSYSADADEYETLLQVPDADARAMYSCGLTCRAICRIAEVSGLIDWHGQPLEVLRDPYSKCASRGCYAITCIVALGMARGLWVSTSRHDGQAEPIAGDMVVIGGSPSGAWGGPEHILTVTGRDGAMVESIDGGQTDARNGYHGTAIRKVTRELLSVPAHHELWLVTPGSKRQLNGRPVAGAGRRVQGWTRAGDLPCLP